MATQKGGKRRVNPDSETQRKIARRTAENLGPAEKARRDVFVNALLKGHTKRHAAMLAGYSPTTAQKQAYLMWREPYVQEQYEKLKESLDEEKIVTRKDIIIEMLQQARYDGPFAQHSARVAALKNLSQMLGFDAPIKVEATVAHNVMVVPMVGSVDEWEAAAAESQTALKKDVAT